MIDFKILVVDDEPKFREVYTIILEDKGYETHVAPSGEECLLMLKEEEYDLVLTDLKMVGINGMELLKKIKNNNYPCEVIIITGFGTIDSAVNAMKMGAYSYFIKGSDPEILLNEIEKLSKIKNIDKNNKLMNEQKISSDYLLDSNSKIFKNMLKIVEKSASSNANILILGESGTGKEIVAKHIHKLSNRKNEKLIAVNCQVFSEGVLESELFGHEKGAFTGAIEKRMGIFEEADNSTLFLDEIGEMSQNIQIKLLRVLESRMFERIGSNKSIATNIRLISATNKNLIDKMKEGRFREDLFYRINTITIEVPPLRKRKEDIPILMNFLLNQLQNNMNKKIDKIEDGLIDLLISYNFPGNVRELKNILERLVVLSDDGILRIEDLPDLNIHNDEQDKKVSSLKEARQIAEVKYIKYILGKNNGNITESAKAMDISRKQLYNKLGEYGIKQ